MDTRDFQASRTLRLLVLLVVAVFSLWMEPDGPQPQAAQDTPVAAVPATPAR
jgi:hypothetical protein